jgi:vitamin K-dependent gamma-carboxylase
LFRPVDGASLAVFRIAFGLVIAWECWRYFSKGWIAPNWIDPTYHFTFWGFDWVRPWPGDGMYWQWRLVGILGLLIAAGLFYRLSCAFLFLSITYLFLLDKTWYLNHIYLVCLIAFIMIFVPAHRTWSLDSYLWQRVRTASVPAWGLWLVRAQIAAVYFGGGIAKLNSDWLRGEPLRQWLAERDDFFLLGRFFNYDWFVYLFSYGGLLLDLLIVPFLLWRRTRLFAFAAVVFFHVMNSQLFNIGIFPWLALGATTIFFAPDWPRRALGRLRSTLSLGSAAAKPLAPASPPGPWRRNLLLGFVGAYLLVQVFMPLRHWLYPGNVHWTEEGHRFAWHMKLRDKEMVDFRVFAIDPGSGTRERVYPEDYLTADQFDEMTGRPDMIRQFADHVADEFEQRGRPRPDVHALALIQLNDHEPQLLVDPGRNLAAISDEPFRHADWILPFEE